MREGKYEVEVLHGQQMMTHFIYPQFFFDVLALRTVRISAGIVGINRVITCLADRLMSTQGCRFTIGYMR